MCIHISICWLIRLKLEVKLNNFAVEYYNFNWVMYRARVKIAVPDLGKNHRDFWIGNDPTTSVGQKSHKYLKYHNLDYESFVLLSLTARSVRRPPCLSDILHITCIYCCNCFHVLCT